MNPVETALKLALQAHAGQTDKSNQPYILHLLRVMARMDFDDHDGQVVALLHDTVEDCEMVDLHTLGTYFRPGIVAAVDAISRREEEPYQQYIERCADNPIARRVKLADLDDNLSPLRAYAGVESLRARYTRAIEYIVSLEAAAIANATSR